MSLVFLNSSCEWDHAVSVFLCLSSFSQHNILMVHPCCCRWQDFLLFMALYVYHNFIFAIGYFCIMTGRKLTELHISLQDSDFVSFRYIPRRGSRGRSIFKFGETSKLFSTVAAPIYILTDNAQAFLFLHFLTNTCCLSDDSHSSRCEMLPHCGFDLHFPDGEWCWTSFHVHVGHLNVFFGKVPLHFLCSFLIGLLL